MYKKQKRELVRKKLPKHNNGTDNLDNPYRLNYTPPNLSVNEVNFNPYYKPYKLNLQKTRLIDLYNNRVSNPITNVNASTNTNVNSSTNTNTNVNSNTLTDSSKLAENKSKAVMGGIGMAGNVVGGVIDNYNTSTVKDEYGTEYQKEDVAGSFASGTAKGLGLSASVGFADFGLLALASGTASAIKSATGNSEVDKKIEEARVRRNEQQSRMATDRYNNAVAQGFNPQGQQYMGMYKKGGMIKRADGSYSRRGLWDNIRENAGSGKAPTKQMLEQEKKIKAKYYDGGVLPSTKIKTNPSDNTYVSNQLLTNSGHKGAASWTQDLRKTSNPDGTPTGTGRLEDATLDAIDAVSLASGVGYLGKKAVAAGVRNVGEYLTTKTPLRNAYKLNRRAFKPNSEAANLNLDELRRVYHNSERFLQPDEISFLRKHGYGKEPQYRNDNWTNNFTTDQVNEWWRIRDANRNQLPPPPSEIEFMPDGTTRTVYNQQAQPSIPTILNGIDIRRPINGHAPGTPEWNRLNDIIAQNRQGSYLSKPKKPVNKSGLSKEEVLKKASPKDKDVISKMSEEEFENTVLKPTGEVSVYTPGLSIDKMTYDINNHRMILKDQVPLSNKEYTDLFNERLDLLNDIIAQNNKSGVDYKVKGLTNDGRLVFETPEQTIGNKVLKGETSWGVRINPGEWRGNVEDIANTEYFRSIPGLEMNNTSAGVFADNVARRGTGAYEAINEYLKRLDLGRVKPGFNSQTEFSRSAWENFIKSGRGVGFYANPRTVYGVMKTIVPPAAIIGAAASQKQEYKYGGNIPMKLNKYNYGGNMYPDGGRTPIYVDNPNDPRLRAYNDSNNLYITSLNKYNQVKNITNALNINNDEYGGFNKTGTSVIPKGILDFIEQATKEKYNKTNKPIGVLLPESFGVGIRENLNDGTNTGLESFPNQFMNKDRDETIYVGNENLAKRLSKPVYEYAKPVQPYIYEKPKPKKTSLINTDPRGKKGTYDAATNSIFGQLDKNVKYEQIGESLYKPITPIKKPVQPVVDQKTQPKLQPQPQTKTNLEEKVQDSSPKKLYQGREFMEKYKLKPSYYTSDYLENRLKDSNRKFSDGGNLTPDYEVEHNEVVQGTDTQLEGQENLASDMTKAIGETHENGGVLGTGGERVFSDRLYASPALISALSAMKIRIPKNTTYASIAEKLGRYKGKFEDKLKSSNPINYKTGAAMTERINGLIDVTFEDQEMQKQTENEMKNKYSDGGSIHIKPENRGKFTTYAKSHGKSVQEMAAHIMANKENYSPTIVKRANFAKNAAKWHHAYGGSLPKYNIGGEFDDEDSIEDPPKYSNFDVEILRKMHPAWSGTDEELVNFANLAISKRYKPKYTATSTAPVFNTINTKKIDKLPVNLKPIGEDKFIKGAVEPKNDKSPKNFNELNNFVSPEQAINLGVYLSNLKNINKQSSAFRPEVSSPDYMRNVNMLPYNKYMISKEAQTTGTNIDRTSSSVQDRFGRRMAVTGEAMDRINQAVTNQMQSDMAIRNANVQMSNEYRNRLADASNKYLEMKVSGENAKIANRQAATNAWLQGVMSNVASNRAYEVEKEKMAIARMEANRGTAERSRIPLWLAGSTDPYNVPTDDELISYGKNYPTKQPRILELRPDLKGKFAKGGYIKKMNKAYC